MMAITTRSSTRVKALRRMGISLTSRYDREGNQDRDRSSMERAEEHATCAAAAENRPKNGFPVPTAGPHRTPRSVRFAGKPRSTDPPDC